MPSLNGKIVRLTPAKDFLQLVYYVQFFVAAIGAVFGLVGYQWGFLFTAIALVGVTAVMIFAGETEKSSNCLNPHLIILRDIYDAHIDREKRYTRRRITFKATSEKVEHYLFKVSWTGLVPGVIINCRREFGVLLQEHSPLPSKTLPWQLCELKFHKPMKRGEVREIELEYRAGDPGGNTAMPYILLAYTHVLRCEETICTLTFAENAAPKSVILFYGNDSGVALKREVKSLDPDSGKYIINARPEHGQRLSIEWEYGGGTVLSTKELKQSITENMQVVR